MMLELEELVKIGLIVDSVLNSLDSTKECEKNIIALLGTTTIINNRSIMRLNDEILGSILFGLFTKEDINKAVDYLLRNKSIIYDKTKNEYVLFEGSSIDLREEVNKVRLSKLTTSGSTKILRNSFDLSFVVPKRYNFQNGVMRYFREELISFEELDEEKLSVDYDREDGKVYYVIPFTTSDVKKIKRKLLQFNCDSSLFITSNVPIEIESELLELQAIDRIYSKKEILSAGPNVKKELDHYRAAAKNVIKRAMKILRSNVQMNASGYFQGNCINGKIEKYVDVSNLASDICETNYFNYPVFLMK